MNLVLDTNAVLYFLGGRLVEPLPEGQYLVSVISEMELLSYPSLQPSEEDRIRAFLSDVIVVNLTREIAETAVRLRRQHGLNLPDAIIAATSLVLDAELLTNDSHFRQVSEVSSKSLDLKGE